MELVNERLKAINWNELIEYYYKKRIAEFLNYPSSMNKNYFIR